MRERVIIAPDRRIDGSTDRRIDVDLVSLVRASSRPFVLDRPNRFETIGITFRHGGVIALLGVCADELDGAPLPLGLLWGAVGGELRERASGATGPDEKLARRCTTFGKWL